MLVMLRYAQLEGAQILHRQGWYRNLPTFPVYPEKVLFIEKISNMKAIG